MKLILYKNIKFLHFTIKNLSATLRKFRYGSNKYNGQFNK